jgi:hypothetical protein
MASLASEEFRPVGTGMSRESNLRPGSKLSNLKSSKGFGNIKSAITEKFILETEAIVNS